MRRTPRSLLLNQRGVVSILAASVIIVMLAVLALAADHGRLAWTRRDLQSIADLAALDASRLLCGASARDASMLQAAALASAANNGFVTGANNVLVAQPGIMQTNAQGVRDFVPTDIGDASSVKVSVTQHNVPRSLFLGGLLSDNSPLDLGASGVARNPGFGGISVGSYLASIDTSQSALLNAVLGGLLGSNLTLDAVSYQGLVDSNVRLLELVRAHAGLGSVDQLLDANLSLGDFYLLVAQAVSADCVLCASVLQNLAALASPVLDLRVGDLLQVSNQDPEAALDARLNLFDLVTLGAQVANGKHALVAVAGLDLPPLATLDLQLEIIEPPQIAIGPPGRNAVGAWRTQVHTAQLRQDISLKLLSGLAGGILDLNVALEVARSDAWLEDLQCPNARSPNGSATLGVQPGIAFLCVAASGVDCSDSEAVANNPATVLNLLGLVTIKASAWTEVQPPAPSILTFTGPFEPDAVPPRPETQRVGSPPIQSVAYALENLSNNLHLEVNLLGLVLNLDQLLSSVLNLLRPVLAALAPLIDGLLASLGISVGGVDVRVFTLAGGGPGSIPPVPLPTLVR